MLNKVYQKVILHFYHRNTLNTFGYHFNTFLYTKIYCAHTYTPHRKNKCELLISGSHVKHISVNIKSECQT